MELTTKFDMFEEVNITALNNYPGHVIGIQMEGNNLFYVIEYWWNGECKTVKQSEFELSKTEVMPKCGI